MDEARSERLRMPHLPALDGLRGIALIFVLLFHSGFGWVRAGYLPLSSFFVLSGFLITALLLLERQRTGRISLKAFWGRRARRLVPGVILGLGVVAAYVAFGAREPIRHLQGDAIATIFWVTNWRFIATGQTYEDAFSSPSPLQHFWSLAVEEQFYLVLPLLAVGLLAWRGKRVFALVVGAMTVASAVAMRVIHQPGDEPFRAYLGTDVRAAELLIGVLLACALIGPNGLRRIRGRWRPVFDGASALALAGLVWAWIRVPAYSDAIFEGGLTALALVAALVVAAGTDESTIVSRVLRLRGLTDLGRISYGIYLFHWPVFLWLDPDRVPLGPWPLFGLRMAITVALAVLSFVLVETPIRNGRMPARIGGVAWANGSVATIGLLVVGLAGVPAPVDIPFQGRDELVVAGGPSSSTTLPSTTTPTTEPSTTVVPTSDGATPSTAAPATSETTTAPTLGVVDATTTTPPPTAPPGPVRVLVVGDSVGDNLAWGLSQWGQQTGAVEVNNQSILGCMVTRGGLRRDPGGGGYPIPSRCEDFAATWPGYVSAFDPDVVVVATGLNEIWDRKLDSWPDYRGPGDPVFDAWMLSEYAAAVNAAASNGAAVVWVVPPCVEYQNYGSTHLNSQHDHIGNDRIDHLRGSVLPALAAQGVVRLADLHREVCPGGNHLKTLYGIGNARPDGVHFSGPVAEELVRSYLGPIVVAAAGR